MKKYIFYILAFSLCFAACSEITDEDEKKCLNTCPEGQIQKEDCTCYIPQPLNATEEQQKEILQAITDNKENKLLNIANKILPDSPINLNNAADIQRFKNLYSKQKEISSRLEGAQESLTLLSLLAPLDKFDKTFKFLLEKGANPNLETLGGLKPIRIAILADQEEKVKMLLEAGATADFENENNIIIETFNLKKYKALKALTTFAKKKELNFHFPSSYFMDAMANKQEDLAAAVLPLIDGNFINMPNSFGLVPLVQAAYLGDLKLIDSLVENGADMELKDYNSRTPILSYLNEVYIGQIEGNFPKNKKKEVKNVVKALLDKGADKDAKDPNGENIMFYAVRLDDFALLDLLVTNFKIDVNTKNNQGETPLFTAAQISPNLVPGLLQKGANPKVTDNNGRTPAIAAVEIGNIDIYDMLENAPAPIL